MGSRAIARDQSIHRPNQKIFEKQEEWILNMRDEMNIDARRIQNEAGYD
jgi:hypothetical protein